MNISNSVRYRMGIDDLEDVLKNLNDDQTNDDLTQMREAMGVLQHHDAVSGTAKQAVTFDYAERLHAGFLACENVITKAAEKEFGSI